MGCDIHLYREKQVDGQWVTADVWEEDDDGEGGTYSEVPWQNRFTDRNYKLFGLLSKGVRADYPFSFEPRGLPFNACNEVEANSERWNGDGHSHSYLYLHELKDMRELMKVATIKVSGMMDRNRLTALRASIDSGKPDWNQLYPYCQWAGLDNYEEFEIDAPADFIIGNSMDTIIALFDGIDGENHRIVFWFDN
ncbi:hypothetical protein [Serratia marcescens]|uniref:hypothetical protein n=1 Tax=Serratia TaxID=613 RepID=UPI003BA26412